MTWKNESARHAMASRGIATRITKPPKYSRKSIDNMSRKELTIEVKKVFDETLYEFVNKMEEAEQKGELFVTDYDEYIKYKKEYGGVSNEWIEIPGWGKEPRMGAYTMFDVKPDWSEEKIKSEFRKRREEIMKTVKDSKEKEFKSITQDLHIFTDKKLASKKGEHGWSVSKIDKPKGSNSLLLLTYDGGAYDYFSYEAGYGGGLLSKALDKKLKERFGNKVMREDYTTWASEIYDVR